jgi:DNA-binding NarL/FixJ family response regulator
MTGRPIRVVLVDDEALVRAGLRMLLESADDLAVVGEADDGADAVDLVARARPDVVLMDVRMPRLDGLAATEAVRRVADPPDVIVLTTFDADDHVFRALEAGAAGFLLKDTPPRQLIEAVRVVAAGQSMLSPAVTRRVIGRLADDGRADRRRAALARIEGLTPREREVLVEVGNGCSNAEIAGLLHLSEATVKSHMTRLFEKLGVDNRVQVAIVAHRAGLAN